MFPVSSSSVHHDRRPDLNSKRRPFTSFCFPCLKSLLFWFLCLSVPRVATRPSALARVKSAWEFGGIAASAVSPLAASPHARRSREIFAAGCGYPKPAVWLSNSRVAAPPSSPFAGVHAAIRGSPSPPFAGDHAAVHGSPVRGRSRRRPPMTQARRPAADSSPVDPVHMFRPGVPCLSCCAHRNILNYHVLSCPRRLVEGMRLL